MSYIGAKDSQQPFLRFVASPEFAATKWIVLIWSIVFVIATWAAQATHAFAMESFQIAVSCLGLMLIVSWYALYGELNWIRMLRFIAVVVLTSGLGGWISDLSSAECGEMVNVTLLATSIGLAYFYFVRRLLGWRILHPLRMAGQVSTRQFSIAESMVWMLYFSFFTVLANQVRIQVFPRVGDFMFFVSLGILFPVAVSFVCLWLVARYSFKVLGWLIPCIALAIATVLAVSFYGFGGASFREAKDWFFWPNLIWFSVTGLAVALAAGELRRHGFVLAFGGTYALPADGDLSTFRRTYLEDQIRSITSWQGLSQRIHDGLQTRLDARKAALESELSSLIREQPDTEADELG